jgi:tripartite-type tricarboxylate transporter receptor subunit TctC
VSCSAARAREGRIRPLAVTTTQRLTALPDVPTIDESSLGGFELKEWNGLYAPSATPAGILDRLNAAARRGLAQPAVKARIATRGGPCGRLGAGRFDGAGSGPARGHEDPVAEAGMTVD